MLSSHELTGGRGIGKDPSTTSVDPAWLPDDPHVSLGVWVSSVQRSPPVLQKGQRLRPICKARFLKHAGWLTCAESTAHISTQVFTRPCTASVVGFSVNAFEVSTRSSQSVKVCGFALVSLSTIKVALVEDRTETSMRFGAAVTPSQTRNKFGVWVCVYRVSALCPVRNLRSQSNWTMGCATHMMNVHVSHHCRCHI